MSTSASLRPDLPEPPASAFAETRRRSSLLPWLLFALIWGLATALLILGAEAATLVAAL